MINYNEIASRWQKAWEEARLFEADVNDKESYLVTAALPYPNGPQHIGHLRTYGTADVLARYKRMKGFNVLFPMAFHATGTPILAFAKRLKNKDEELIKELKMFHIPDEEIAKMTDPLYITNYFIREIEAGMKLAGYSIDWRRKFITIEPFFSKFIEWQFGLLNKKKLLVKGRHPVGWCPNENNAVGMHDTKHDVEPEIEKEISIRFKAEREEAYALCTTYRPETISGVTNLFINKGAEYLLCKMGNDSYYLSKNTYAALKYQFKIDVIKSVSNEELLKKKFINPITKEVIPVLPGFFVRDNIGTGIVMSVPAHAPFDYVAIERLKAEKYPVEGIKPKVVIRVNSENEEGELPVIEYMKKVNADINSSDDLIENVSKLEYKEESHMGKMVVKGYKGMDETSAREKIKSELISKEDGFETYVLLNAPIYCRCGYAVVVKVVEDQWFINYGDEKWKEKTRKTFKNVNILPEKTKNAFESAIEWIGLRAVARAEGLGTRFPLDPTKIIESLSDSTIYMAFYTISNYLRDIGPERLKPEVFDYILLGKGNSESIASSTGVDFELLKKAKESFDYWYVNTSRHSGADLIFNHLTMYLFNHAEIFEQKNWPKQIAVNGSVLSEGEKMSKSLGNTVPLSDGIKKYGADMIRFVVVGGADLFSDSEFSIEAINGVNERMEFLYNTAKNVDDLESKELKPIDYWLYSKLNRKIEKVNECMEILELRTVATSVLYDSVKELRRYFNRKGGNSIVVKDYLSSLSLLLSPMTPHISEELWHILGNTTFASTEKWPLPESGMINDKIERDEEMIDQLIIDSKQVIELVKRKTNKDPKLVKFIIASEWKREVAKLAKGEKDMKKIMKNASEDEKLKGVDKEKVANYVTKLAKKQVFEEINNETDELILFSDAREYISSTLKCNVEIEKEEGSKSPKANAAEPGRPGIEILT